MAAIGLISSLLTLVSTTIDVVRLAKVFYNAPNELVCVISELEEYHGLLQEIKDINQWKAIGIVDGSYARSMQIIWKLRTLVDTKLLNRKFGAPGKMRRLAWIRNKSKVYVLMESLKESKHRLALALSAAGLSASAQAVRHLDSQTEDISLLQAITITMREDIQFQAEMTRSAIERYNRLVEEMLDGLRSGSPHSQLREFSSRFGESSRLLSSTNQTQRTSTIQSSTDEIRETFYDCADSPEFSEAFLHLNGSISQGPATSFEVSAFSLPEEYTINQGPGHVSKVISMSEHSAEDSKRVDRGYDLRFAISPRKWQEVCIFTRINIRSKYYGVTRITKTSLVTPLPGVMRLPARLDDDIATLLAATELSAGGTILSLEVNDGAHSPEIDISTVSISELDLIPLDIATEFFDSIQDLGCPQILEGEVIHLRVIQIQPPPTASQTEHFAPKG